MEEIIRLRRACVDEHIGQENAHNWPAVYDTFSPHESTIDVIPFHTQFSGLSGIRDFYQVVDAAFPDFKIDVWGEYDSRGCSVREMTIEGTHKGEWCGVAATGRRAKFHLVVLYLFGKGSASGKVAAERIYFDNDTIMKQIRGEVEPSIPAFGRQMAVAK